MLQKKIKNLYHLQKINIEVYCDNVLVIDQYDNDINKPENKVIYPFKHGFNLVEHCDEYEYPSTLKKAKKFNEIMNEEMNIEELINIETCKRDEDYDQIVQHIKSIGIFINDKNKLKQRINKRFQHCIHK